MSEGSARLVPSPGHPFDFTLTGASGVEKFTRIDGPHIASINSYQCNGMAAAVDEFNFVAATVFVHVNNGAYIATTKFFVR